MIKEKLKTLRRTLRYYLIRLLIGSMRLLPISKIPKLKLLLIKAIKTFGTKEINKAYELLPVEFSDRKDSIIHGMIENVALNVLEIIYYDKIIKANPDFCKFENWEIVENIKKQGKTPLLLVGHFCDWEVMGYELVKAGLDLTVIARPNNLQKMTDYINSLRQNHKLRVVMQNNIMEAIRLLHHNMPVAILSDLNAREWGYQVDFFGRNASFYSAPVIISIRSGMPLIPVFPERQPNGNIIFKVKPPIVWEKGESMRERVQKYAKVYEEEYRKRPDLWFWFHDRYSFAEMGKKR